MILTLDKQSRLIDFSKIEINLLNEVNQNDSAVALNLEYQQSHKGILINFSSQFQY